MFELKDVEDTLTGTIETSSDGDGFKLTQNLKDGSFEDGLASVIITAEDAPMILKELAKYVESLGEKTSNKAVRGCENFNVIDK